MIHRPGLLTFLFSIAPILALPAIGAEQVLDLEPETTRVTFTLKAAVHDVAGTLYLHGGRIRFDAATGVASGEVSIDAKRAETGSEKRDKKMHKKVLESEHHPLIVFRPERIEGEIAAEGSSEIQLIGTVTLLGTDHALTLPSTVEIEDGAVSTRATFAVPYVEWGLHDPSVLFLRVAKVVEVTISAVGTLSAAAGPSAAGR